MRSNRVRVKMVLLATIASVASVSGTAWAAEDPDGGDGGCPQGIASETLRTHCWSNDCCWVYWNRTRDFNHVTCIGGTPGYNVHVGEAGSCCEL